MICSQIDTTTTYDSAGRVKDITKSVSGYKQAFAYQNVGTGTEAHTITTKTETFKDTTTQTSVTNGSLFISATLAKGSSSYQALYATYDNAAKPLTEQVGSQAATLGYDDQGNLSYDSMLSAPGQTTYTYAPQDSKLTSSSYSKLSQSAAYTYSADRTQLTSAKIGTTTTNYAYNATTGDITAAGSNGYTYNATTGRLATRTGAAATYTYDTAGRRTSGAGITYNWQGQRLASAQGSSGTSSYVYDSTGQRLTKQTGSTTTSYVYDGIKLATLSAKSGSATSSLIYLYGAASTPVGASYTAPGSTSPTNFQIVSDAHGDVRELRDTSGTAFARYDYDAYGNVTSSQTFATTLISAALAQTISELQPLRYAGYLFDSETGLYYCSQRYYDPATASFISRDPAKADGEKSLYMYCGGEPVGSTDVNGLWGMNGHWGLTYEAARRVGFSSSFSAAAGDGSQYPDKKWGAWWPGYWHIHFNYGQKRAKTLPFGTSNPWGKATFGPLSPDSRVNFYNKYLSKAKIYWRQKKPTSAAFNLGIGLHALQDSYAHGNIHPLSHQFPISTAKNWDNPGVGGPRFERAEAKTITCMKAFSSFIKNKR